MSSPAARRWVANASPVILLAKVARVSLLDSLATEVIIPSDVAQEILQGPADDPGRLWLSGDGAPNVRDPGPLTAAIAAWDLGAGESQVLSWAHGHPGFEAILDDRAARNCAAALGIPVRGTLGIILLAKQEGLVPLVAPILQELRDAGWRIDTAVVDAALRLAGEL